MAEQARPCPAPSPVREWLRPMGTAALKPRATSFIRVALICAHARALSLPPTVTHIICPPLVPIYAHVFSCVSSHTTGWDTRRPSPARPSPSIWPRTSSVTRQGRIFSRTDGLPRNPRGPGAQTRAPYIPFAPPFLTPPPSTLPKEMSPNTSTPGIAPAVPGLALCAFRVRLICR